VVTDAAEAAQLMSGLSSQQALRDLNAAIRYLKEQAWIEPGRLGLAGFSMGGTLALTMATHNSDLKAAVVFSGKVPPIETLDALLCPILFHHGAADAWVTSKEADTLRQGLRQYGKRGEVVSYPDAPHAFFNETRPEVFRPAAAAEAWQRTLRFLAEHLR
jgi:carboxymethylenebutenolidase